VTDDLNITVKTKLSVIKSFSQIFDLITILPNLTRRCRRSVRRSPAINIVRAALLLIGRALFLKEGKISSYYDIVLQ